MTKHYSPHIHLVPVSLWKQNMRALMSQHHWTKFRKALLENDGLTCRTCGKQEAESRKLSAHEEWHYDEETEPATARITDVALVCWHCHHVEHWGVTKSLVAQGQLKQSAIDDTIAHFCRLNDVGRIDFDAHEEHASQDWARRSARNWRVDYGPFLGWVVATFEQDPFNAEEWSQPVKLKWAECPPPSASDLVAVLRPQSQLR